MGGLIRSLGRTRHAALDDPAMHVGEAIADGLTELVEAGAVASKSPFLDSSHRLADQICNLLFSQKDWGGVCVLMV